jgi:uncharacterized protein (DUF433 family)
MRKAANNSLLTRREVVEIAHVPLGALDKAIEQKIVTVHRRRERSLLASEDVGVIALLQKLALPLPVTVKRKIRRWVRETEPYRTGNGSELQLGDALVVRWSPEVSETVHAAESYARLREQWIETDPTIKGGEPVLRGTRIGVRAVAQRIEHGDTIQTLTEDYPHIPAEAFQTAYTYARAHPRRGRPTPLWRDGDEALDRRGPLPVTG